MRFSLQLFALAPEEYLQLVRHAEHLGFTTVWLADHVITPLEYAKRYPYNNSGDPGYRPEAPLADVAVTLGFLAAQTTHIRLGTGVFVLPLRNIFHVARSWATLQHLSGGRAVLGVGVGWMAEEFDAIGERFVDRGPRMDEMLQVLALLWSGETVSFEGAFHRFPELVFGGAPAEPIPLVFGGHARAALRRAARHGSGWFGPNVDLDESVRYRRLIEVLRAEEGRSHTPFDYHVRLVGDITSANARRYMDAGFEDLVFSPFGRLPPSATARDRLDALSAAREALDDVWTSPF